MATNNEEVKKVLAGPLWVIFIMAVIVFTMPPIVFSLVVHSYAKVGADSYYVILWFFAPGIIAGICSLKRLLK